MGHSYVSCKMHYVFNTKERRRLLTPELQERLWPYMAGIANNNGITVLSVGGTEDHVHLLVALPPTASIADAIKKIKGVSSKWIHETFPMQKDFAWQEGYAAFSVSISSLEKTIEYIKDQEKHHRKKSFQEELLSFLKAHGIPYDERYIWT